MSPKNPYPGIFIALEGLDGSGLSTQAKLLQENLRLSDIGAYATKEPTNNVIGGVIRGVLTGALNGLPSGCLQLLFAADRAHHLNREIIPQLQEGKVIISDRYFWTSVAYGGVDLDREWLLEVNKNFIQPDLTIFLSVPVSTTMNRLKKDRFELELFEKEKELEKILKNYDWLKRKFGGLITEVEATGDRGEIAERILEKVKALGKFRKLESLKKLK